MKRSLRRLLHSSKDNVERPSQPPFNSNDAASHTEPAESHVVMIEHTEAEQLEELEHRRRNFEALQRQMGAEIYQSVSLPIRPLPHTQISRRPASPTHPALSKAQVQSRASIGKPQRPDHNRHVLDWPEKPAWYITAVPELPGDHAVYLCATCRHINLAWIFQDSEPASTALAEDYICLGPYSEISAEKTCGLCCIVIATVTDRMRLSMRQDWAKLDIDYSRLITAKWHLSPFVRKDNGKPARSSFAFLHHDLSPGMKAPELTPFALRQIVTRGRGGRRIATDGLDYSWIRTTIARCEVNTDMPPKSFKVPLRVIDTLDLCIVDFDCDTEEEYVALSYPWGGVKQLTFDTRTEPLLRRPFGLTEVFEHLAQTIQDAIVLVSKVGVRYLWIDALCILQDDPEDVKRYITQMKEIYLHSYFTIFAISGHDANYGLPGVRQGSRALRQIVRDVSGITIANCLPWSTDCDFEAFGGWASRAWTFQERFHSQRGVYIADGGIHINCMHILSPEDEHCWHPARRVDNFVNTGHMFFFAGLDSRCVPDLGYRERTEFDLYAIYVYNYTPRKLTYASDALRAFNGMVTHLEDAFDSEIIHGIPEAEFDAGLLWSPLGKSSRRPQFPSWSWLGWTGTAAYPWAHERDTFISTDNSPLEWLDAEVARENQARVAYETTVEGREVFVVPEDGPRTLRESEDTNIAWFTSDDLCMPDSALRGRWLQHCRKQTSDHLGLREFCRRNRARWRRLDIYHEYWPVDMPLKRYYTLRQGDDGDHRLTFRTLLAEFRVRGQVFKRARLYNVKEPIHRLAICDEDGHRAGYIEIPEPRDDDDLSKHLGRHEFVALSRSTSDGKFEPAPDRLTCRRREGVPPEAKVYKFTRFGMVEDVPSNESDSEHIDSQGGFDTRVYEDRRPWCMFNVLMLSRKGFVSYREAVGRIHIDAFLAQGARVETVELE